ncbi:hypothetical protein, partial [Nonomuraea angiospora]|uniref:hypothetical protein n=1 Tax=Nonomuraea angiospora TaxID=46172 RepID=UPI0029AFA82A
TPGPTKILPTEPAPGPALIPASGSTVGERVIRRRRRPAVPLIAVAVAALATAGVLYARGATSGGATTQATPSETSAARKSTSGPASTPSPKTASGSTTAAPPAGAGAIPEAFAGTWTGRVVSQDDRKQAADVTITLTGGQSTGTWANGDCAQQATLTRVRSDTVLEMTVAQRDRCVGGDMTLTLNDPESLDLVRQEGASALEYRGSLRRS